MQLRPYGQPAAGGQVIIIIIIISNITTIIIIGNLPQVARSASLCPRASQM